MEAILYFLIFLMGAFFGSFFTLAVHRIPLGEDITYTHSYCPNCHHKLGILDLFPILSYLFLRGKCRYCKEPIRIRYFLLEIVSGLTFLLFAFSLQFHFYELEISKWVYFAFTILYFCSLFIIAGIDKEKRTIQKSVLIFGLLVVTGYIIYLYIVGKANIYRYVIYLIILLLLILVETILLKKKAKDYYFIQIMGLVLYIGLYSGEAILLLTVILTVLSMGLDQLLERIVYTRKNKKEEKSLETISKSELEEKRKIPVGFYLVVSNVIMMIYVNLLANYIM